MDLNIDEMTTVDKLKAMEVLWDDMCRNVENVASPQWHGELLLERENNIQLGNDTFIGWEKVKKELLDLS